MENPEGVLHLLDEFAKVKSKEIPNDLEEYLLYVAASGDPVYQWSLIKSLYRQKLINVITEFYETCPMMDIPSCPNVDPFNYETMKNSLLERLDSFASAPFTIQRISELLTTPRKQYNRVDKFMRAIEKNIWVVSTREPGQREPTIGQEASGNLVNGVAPRVRVTVKHPKRGKSIEERIKSGHPQLIDDDEDESMEEEDDESMEVKSNQELLSNNDSEDTPLQCTSVKDLIEKYENGTIFCGTEEKSVQLEESAVSSEASSTPPIAVSASSSTTESNSEQESDEEEVNIDKLVTADESPKIELTESSEGDKLEDVENKNVNSDNSENEISIPIVEVVKEDSNQALSENCLPESTNFYSDVSKPDTTNQSDESSSTNEEAETVTVMEVLGLENEVDNSDSDPQPILEEPGSEDFASVTESSDEKETDEINEAEVKVDVTNEAEAEEKPVIREVEDSAETEKLDSNTGIVVELEADSSSPDDASIPVPALSDALAFIESKETLPPKKLKTEESSEKEDIIAPSVSEKSLELKGENKDLANAEESCSSSDFETFNKASELAQVEAEMCLPSDLLGTKIGGEIEKSSEMIVEEADKMEEMDVDDYNTSSPMVEEETLEPMDVS